MAANESFFRNQNGGCGFVLKPEYLRSVSQVSFNPSDPEDIKVAQSSYHIILIVAQFLH